MVKDAVQPPAQAKTAVPALMYLAQITPCLFLMLLFSAQPQYYEHNMEEYKFRNCSKE